MVKHKRVQFPPRNRKSAYYWAFIFPLDYQHRGWRGGSALGWATNAPGSLLNSPHRAERRRERIVQRAASTAISNAVASVDSGRHPRVYRWAQS